MRRLLFLWAGRTNPAQPIGNNTPNSYSYQPAYVLVGLGNTPLLNSESPRTSVSSLILNLYIITKLTEIKMTLKTLAAITISMFISAGAVLAGTIQIEHTYARASSPVAKSGAAFMHIMNMGEEDDTLVAVRTSAAKMPELHTHIMEDGVAKMREVEGGFVIPAGGVTKLERGALHIMLMGLTQSLNQGDTITLTLIFENAGEITIDVVVDNERQGNMEQMGGNSMDHSNMDHSNMGDSTMTPPSND